MGNLSAGQKFAPALVCSGVVFGLSLPAHALSAFWPAVPKAPTSWGLLTQPAGWAELSIGIGQGRTTEYFDADGKRQTLDDGFSDPEIDLDLNGIHGGTRLYLLEGSYGLLWDGFEVGLATAWVENRYSGSVVLGEGSSAATFNVNQTGIGLGDTIVRAAYQPPDPSPVQVIGSVHVRIPTGQADHLSGAESEATQEVAVGTGQWDFGTDATVLWSHDQFAALAFLGAIFRGAAEYQESRGPNGKRDPGDVVHAGIGALGRAGERVIAGAIVSGYRAGETEVDGEVQSSTAATLIDVIPFVSVELGSAFTISVMGGLPRLGSSQGIQPPGYSGSGAVVTGFPVYGSNEGTASGLTFGGTLLLSATL